MKPRDKAAKILEKAYNHATNSPYQPGSNYWIEMYIDSVADAIEKEHQAYEELREEAERLAEALRYNMQVGKPTTYKSMEALKKLGGGRC